MDYAKGEYEIENIERFSEFLSAFAKQLLDETAETYFRPLQKMDDDHIFGEIQIVKYTGHKVDMLRELIKRHSDGVKADDEHEIPFGK